MTRKKPELQPDRRQGRRESPLDVQLKEVTNDLIRGPASIGEAITKEAYDRWLNSWVLPTLDRVHGTLFKRRILQQRRRQKRLNDQGGMTE